MRVAISVLLFAFFTFSSCQNTFQQGESIYLNRCQNCHMEQGEGLKKLIPSLKSSQYISKSSSDLVCIILKGTEVIPLEQRSPQVMPGLINITPVEMTNLVNYLNFKFGNQEETTLTIIESQMQKCLEK